MMVNLLSIKIMNVDCLIQKSFHFPFILLFCSRNKMKKTFSFISLIFNFIKLANKKISTVENVIKYHIMSIANSIGTFVAEVEGKKIHKIDSLLPIVITNRFSITSDSVRNELLLGKKIANNDRHNKIIFY